MHGDFFDTNVLLYTASADIRKADRAEELLIQGGSISVQVLNEAAHVARRKMRLSWDEIEALLAGWQALLKVHALDLAVHERGVAVARRYQLGLYDAMIVAAALQTDCARLWSEDMREGLLVEGCLRVCNPFR